MHTVPAGIWHEEKKTQHTSRLRFARHDRAASPTLTFEQLAKRLAAEWENLPEEVKSVYRHKSNEEALRHETIGAAMVLTQVDGPSGGGWGGP